MKLQARNFVVRKPKTVDITVFFKKFCIATRTKIGSTPRGAANFGAGNCLTRPRPGDGGASRLVPVGDSSSRIVALGFNLVSVCSQNRPTLPQSAAPLGVLPLLVLVVVRLGRAPATAASAA